MAKAPSRTFAYVDALSFSKDRSCLEEPAFHKDYKAYITNHALSYHADAVLSANLMNERPGLDSALQFLFLLNTLRPRKRFSKWLKSTVSDDVHTVAEYYDCSTRCARELTALHSSEQLTIMRARLDKGGMAAKGSRNDST